MKILNKLAVSAVTVTLLGGAIPAFAQTPTTTATTTNSALVNQISTLLQQINSLQAQIAELNKKKGDLTSDLMATWKLTKSLSLGVSGEEVKLLQEILAADPDIYPEGLVTGYFGALTEKAVKKFQQKNEIEQVGIVGPKTLAKLNKWIEDGKKLPPGLMKKLNVNIATSTATTTPGAQITICHLPGGNKEKGQTITIGAPAWSAHAKHGDTIGACGTSSTTPPTATTTPDTIAPIISSLGATSSASTTATVSWNTNEAARGTIWYATTTPVSSAATSVSDSTLKTSHVFNLSGLTASTTYYYKVESKDSTGNTSTSSDSWFATTP